MENERLCSKLEHLEEIFVSNTARRAETPWGKVRVGVFTALCSPLCDHQVRDEDDEMSAEGSDPAEGRSSEDRLRMVSGACDSVVTWGYICTCVGGIW